MDSTVSEEDDLLDKADALMRKHRVFVASAGGADTANDDVPLLTEVVSAATLVPGVIPAPAAAPLEPLRDALAAELEAWLDQELPRHVLRVLDGISDQLILQLSLKARSELLPRLHRALESPPPAANPAPPDD